MNKPYLIGTDIGTSSTKTVITDAEGNVISLASQAYGILTPQPAWAGQWHEVWLEAVKNTIRQAVFAGGIKAGYGGMSTAGALTKWFSEQFEPEVPF